MTELRKFQKTHIRIIQKQLQISMIKKYLKKDIYLQKKDKKLMMIKDENSSIIMEYQKITNVLKDSETVTHENDEQILKEIPKERYISPEERQRIIDNLR